MCGGDVEEIPCALERVAPDRALPRRRRGGGRSRRRERSAAGGEDGEGLVEPVGLGAGGRGGRAGGREPAGGKGCDGDGDECMYDVCEWLGEGRGECRWEAVEDP